MKVSLATVLRMIVLFIFWAGSAQGAVVDPRVSSALASAPPGETVSVIVTFDTPDTVAALAQHAAGQGGSGVVRTLRSRAERSQGAVRAMLQDKGRKYRPLWIINGLATEADSTLLQALADNPGVKEIRLNGTVQRPAVRPAQIGGTFWNLQAVRAPELWDQGIRGTGVTVALFDSGVDITLPALGSKWRGSPGGWFNPYAAGCTPETCTPCEASASTPCDDATPPDAGHGTAVAGIVLGSDGSTTTGVAPGANWIAAKIFRDNDTAPFDVIHAAFQWALDPDGNPATPDAPAVVNNSWGFEGAENECIEDFRSDVQTLRAAGISVVFASGNGGPASSTSISPGNYPESLAVGAMGPDGSLAPFSARGPSACGGSLYPAMTAPGVDIHTVAPGGELIIVSGTSFSAPHLSGVLALLKQAVPGATTLHLESAVKGGARDLGPAGNDNDYGFGLVDAVSSLNVLRTPPAAAQPISPENGAVTASSVTFNWVPGSSPYGIPVTDTLLVSQSADFSTRVAVGGGSATGILLAGSGGLLGVLAALALRRRRGMALLLASLSVALVVACGGGSGGDDDENPAASKTVSGLSPGVTYYWKVVSDNAVGRTAESEVRVFTVR